MKINCLIVDDEPIARDILLTYISRIPELSLVKSCKNATEAYKSLHEHVIDLIFLDIQIPIITGIDFLRSLSKPPMVIFTTAYANFAVEGFELNSIDYLLKPITFERFEKAIQKVFDKISHHQENAPAKQRLDYIFIKQDNKLVRVNFSAIDYIQAEKDFCSVYLGQKRLLASMHLKLFEDLLPATKFLRIHRSYLINLDKITALKGNTVELGNIELPIGASYRSKLSEKLGL